MDQYTMTEEAYKNGYEAGIKKFAEKLKENIDNGELYSTVDDYLLTTNHIKSVVKELIEQR